MSTPKPGTPVAAPPSDAAVAFRKQKRLRLIGYVRVSKAREIMYSPEQQIMAMQAYAEVNDIEIIRIEQDLNKTGRSTGFEKRQIGAIIAAVADGEADGVLVFKFSRFGRARIKNLAYIALLQEKGGVLLSATEVGNEDSSSGRFSRNIIMSMDEFQSEQIGENWKLTHQRRRNAGLPHTGEPPFGYMRCPDCTRNQQDNGFNYCESCKGVYVVDPVRGPVLSEMYRRFIAGEAMSALVTEMATRGITSTKGAAMRNAAWLSTMDTGFAAGLLRARSNKKANPNLLESWDLWTHGAHPALITMEEWDAYKKRRLARKKLPPRSRDPKYALSGLIRCGGTRTDGTLCLSLLHAEPTRQRNGAVSISYRCKYRDSLHICNGRGVSSAIAERVVYDWIVAQAADESTAEAAMLSAAKASRARNEAQEILAQVERIKAAQSKVASGWMSGLLKDEDYRNLTEENDVALQKALAQYELAQQVLSAAVLGPEDYRPLAENWRHATPSEKNAFLRHVVDHLLSVNGEGRKYSTARVVAKGEAYPYELPTFGRRVGVPTLVAAKR